MVTLVHRIPTPKIEDKIQVLFQDILKNTNVLLFNLWKETLSS